MNTFRRSFIKRKPLRKASAKAQSAMEYLMTYGWAILIISVVLAALFQLGVFNPMTFAPKAPPGSCQVFRPNGPYTTSFINLEGICSGELPQYAAQFNGQSSYILASLKESTTNMTLCAWVYWTSLPPAGIESVEPVSCNSGNGAFEFYPNQPIWWACGNVGGVTGPPMAIDKWYFICGTYNSSSKSELYLNGVLVNSAANTAGSFSQIKIGDGYNVQSGGNLYQYYFPGQVANVQLYNTSLSANEIQALYMEGIGGAPIDLQHLVAWWPLNGNANDYSGNGNNGQINGNVNFISNWYSGYTPP